MSRVQCRYRNIHNITLRDLKRRMPFEVRDDCQGRPLGSMTMRSSEQVAKPRAEVRLSKEIPQHSQGPLVRPVSGPFHMRLQALPMQKARAEDHGAGVESNRNL